MNMDGKIMWKTKKNPDFNKGSMVLADGLILAHQSKSRICCFYHSTRCKSQAIPIESIIRQLILVSFFILKEMME
jgi:hypothetical protein